jgi:Domain of unknown function (DUF4279)
VIGPSVRPHRKGAGSPNRSPSEAPFPDGWSHDRSVAMAIRETDTRSETEVWVGLRITGDFDPDDITRRLGRDPTHTGLKGRVLSRHSGRVASTSKWAIDSESLIDAPTIEPHLEWLLDLIEPRIGALSAIVANGAFAYADCFWSSTGMGGGPWIEPRSMRRLAALDLPLIISFHYAIDESDDGD